MSGLACAILLTVLLLLCPVSYYCDSGGLGDTTCSLAHARRVLDESCLCLFLRNGLYRALREHNTITCWNSERVAFAITSPITLPAPIVFAPSQQYRLGVSCCCCAHQSQSKVSYASRPTTNLEIRLQYVRNPLSTCMLWSV